MNVAGLIASPGMAQYVCDMALLRTSVVEGVDDKDTRVEGAPIPIEGKALVQPYSPTLAWGSQLTPTGERDQKTWLMISEPVTAIFDTDVAVNTQTNKRYTVVAARNWGDHYETTLREQ